VENGAEGKWPQRDRSAVKLQVGYMTEWSPADQWLLSNPNSPLTKEQERALLLELLMANNAEQAAALLSTI